MHIRFSRKIVHMCIRHSPWSREGGAVQLDSAGTKRWVFKCRNTVEHTQPRDDEFKFVRSDWDWLQLGGRRNFGATEKRKQSVFERLELADLLGKKTVENHWAARRPHVLKF